MFSKIIKKLYSWVIKKEYEKRTKQQKKERKEFVRLLRELYSFVNWLNANFTNRRERKAFWRAVMEGRPVIEKTLENLIKKYEIKDEKEKKIKKKPIPIYKGYQPKGSENEEFELPKGGSGLVK